MTLALTAREEYAETFMLHKYSLAKLNEHKVITKAKNDFEPASPDNAHHSSTHVKGTFLQVHQGKRVIVLITFTGCLQNKLIMWPF